MATKGSNPTPYILNSLFFPTIVKEKERDGQREKEKKRENVRGNIKEKEKERESVGCCCCWILVACEESRPGNCPYVGVGILSCNE